MVPVTLRDHMSGDSVLYIISDKELASLTALWSYSDPLLRRMESNQEFAGCTKWSDLNMRQFQTLVILHLAVLDDVDKELPTKGLRTVLAALCITLSDRVQGELTQVSIHRFAHDEVHIEFSAAITPHRLPKPRARLKLAVDNS